MDPTQIDFGAELDRDPPLWEWPSPVPPYLAELLAEVEELQGDILAGLQGAGFRFVPPPLRGGPPDAKGNR